MRHAQSVTGVAHAGLPGHVGEAEAAKVAVEGIAGGASARGPLGPIVATRWSQRPAVQEVDVDQAVAVVIGSARPEATVSTMSRLPLEPSVWRNVIPVRSVTSRSRIWASEAEERQLAARIVARAPFATFRSGRRHPAPRSGLKGPERTACGAAVSAASRQAEYLHHKLC